MFLGWGHSIKRVMEIVVLTKSVTLKHIVIHTVRKCIVYCTHTMYIVQ